VKTKPTDEIAIGPEVSPGVRSALRRKDGVTKQVFVKLAKEGESIHQGTELAMVGDPTGDNDGAHWHALTSVYKGGPAQVATPAYRDGYDRIFGKQKVGSA